MEKVDITILGATEGEIAPLCALESTRLPGIGGRFFSIRTHRGLRLLIAETGIGKVNAAAITAAALSRVASGEVWNVGCAGAYCGSGLEVGDVLISDNCLLADEGILTRNGPAPLSEIGIPLVVKNGLAFCDAFPAGESLGSAQKILSRSPFSDNAFRLRYGPSLTVGMTSGDLQTASARFHRFQALAENMEGGAIAQTCLLFGVPFLEIRGISNVAGEREKACWDLRAAVDHCLAVVERLLEGYRRIEVNN